jgi:hypothetical protein
LIRIGVGPIAASAVAFATGFIAYLWLMTGPAPVNAASGVHARVHSAFETIDPTLLDAGATAAGSNIQVGFNARFASLDVADASKFVLNRTDDPTESRPAHTPFGERFSFDQSDTPGESLQLASSFDDRFAGNHETSGTVRSAAAAPRENIQRVAAAAIMPRARPADAPRRAQGGRIQLASASATSFPLGYAPADSVTSPAMGSALKELTPKASKPREDGDRSRTAIYDITARTVYLPNGRRLEAHSGLGGHMDDPRYADKRMTGPTPPNVYNLRLREAPFKGTRAIRLIPTDNAKMNGRAGILAHPYLLGPSGASNGCVSIKDYDAFVAAFDRGEIDRIVVVERLGDPPPHRTAADWFRALFRS